MLMDYLFNFNDFSSSVASYKINNQDFIIQLAVPGYSKEDFTITLVNNTIEIHSKDKLIESYDLPNNVDIDNIEATCKNGLLKITVPAIKKSIKNIEIK